MAAVGEADTRAVSKEKKKKERQPLDSSGENAWINAHHNPVASLYTFTSCLDLKDLDGDGDHKLLVGDLASGQHDMKLKIFKGTQLTHEIPLLDLPTGVHAFMMDSQEPAIAVASGTQVFIYKTVRPYFKFTLPLLEVNSEEKRLWEQVKEDEIDPTVLREGLEHLSSNGCVPPLTVRSLTFLQLDAEDLFPFTSVFRPIPLRRQTVVTCMTTLFKSYSDDTAASCIVIGTENKDIYILDPAAFTFLSRLRLPAIPVFLSVYGIFDVDFSISVACRDGCIYSIMKDQSPDLPSLPSISLSSQAVGLLRDEQTITVATMNQTLSCYSAKGKLLWSVVQPDNITAMERMDYKMRSFKAVIIALANFEVRVYKDKFLVNMFKMDDIVVGMKFGQFGREEGSLVLVSQSGALTVKILKRNIVFEVKESKPGPVQSQVAKLNVAKKTKTYVDQTIREIENAKFMHETFQQHLLELKLESARSYVKAISSSLAPVTNSNDTTLTISAQVQGIGPLFKVILLLQNISPSTALTDYYIILQCNESLYSIAKKYMKLPMLVPGVSYSFSTMVECLNDFGQTDSIKVCVHRHGNPVTLLTAVIDMPASENIVL